MSDSRRRRSNKRRIICYARDGKKCFYCGGPTVEYDDPSGVQHPDQATLDHFYPQTQVDGHTWKSPSNYVIACYSCNQEKAEEDPIVFYIRKRLYLQYSVMHSLRLKYGSTEITKKRRSKKR